MILTCNLTSTYTPHPEGVHSAVCVDQIDLGEVEEIFNGEKRKVKKLRLVFETEQLMDDGRPATIKKDFAQTLHPKSNLGMFIEKWRGRKLVDKESVDFSKLIGASCTLVVCHKTSKKTGRIYDDIDTVYKPTKQLKPSGHYDPAAARERIAQWAAKDVQVSNDFSAAASKSHAIGTASQSPTTAGIAISPLAKGISTAQPALNANPKPGSTVVTGRVIPEVAEDDVPF